MREERRARLEGIVATRTSVYLTMELLERSGTVVDGLLPLAGQTWQAGPVESDSVGIEAVIPDRAAERMAEIDDPERALEDTLAELAAIATTDDLYGAAGFEAWERLAALARFFPSEVLPLIDHLLRSGQLDTASQNWLLSALGKAGGAGSEAATALLAALLADVTLPDDLRVSALIAAHQLGAHVTPGVVQATIDVLVGDASSENALPTTAALLLGQLAGHERLPGGSATLIDAGLELVREQAFERGEPSVYFDALGNSGRPDLVAQSFAYLDHPDPAVRLAAAKSLGKLPDDLRTFAELAHVATRDESPSVRAAALEALVALPPTPESADLLRGVAGSDADVVVRDRAVTTLGSHALRGSGEAYDALVDLAGNPGEAGDLARSVLADLEESER